MTKNLVILTKIFPAISPLLSMENHEIMDSIVRTIFDMTDSTGNGRGIRIVMSRRTESGIYFRIIPVSLANLITSLGWT